eukprot:365059-Chlamydomonas_euryale.AAC.6
MFSAQLVIASDSLFADSTCATPPCPQPPASIEPKHPQRSTSATLSVTVTLAFQTHKLLSIYSLMLQRASLSRPRRDSTALSGYLWLER